MCDHQPIKSLLKDWKKASSYVGVKTDEEYVEKTKEYLTHMGPTQTIHYGEDHEFTSSTTNKAPSKLMAILWLLKYSIHDAASHKKMITFLAPNTFSKADSFPSFLTVDFFVEYILYPVTHIVYDQLDNAVSPVNAIVLANYVKEPNKHPQKIKEFVTYTLTSTFIDILLKYGLNATFRVRNDNTIEISTFLNQEKKTKKYNNIIRATTLYELYFAAIPGIIDRNVEKHWGLIFQNFVPRDKLLSTKFPTGTKLKNFFLRLPLAVDDNTVESVTIEKYFEAILTGKISLKDLIGDLQYTVGSEQDMTEVDDVNMILTEKENVDNEEPVLSERTPKNPDRINITLNEDTYTSLRNKIVRKTNNLHVRIRNNESNYVTLSDELEKIKNLTSSLLEIIDDAYDRKKKAAERRRS